MSLFPLFQFVSGTAFATALRESDNAFPIVETVHVLGITLLAGTVAVVDLRLLGLIFKRDKASTIAGQVLPLTWAGFIVMLVSGLLLLAAEAEKDYGNTAFRVKMLLLALAGVNPLVFHSTIYKSVGAWDDLPRTPWRARAAAVVSLTLWSGIIVAGRAIAYWK
jgi:hypothetical protein